MPNWSSKKFERSFCFLALGESRFGECFADNTQSNLSAFIFTLDSLSGTYIVELLCSISHSRGQPSSDLQTSINFLATGIGFLSFREIPQLLGAYVVFCCVASSSISVLQPWLKTLFTQVKGCHHTSAAFPLHECSPSLMQVSEEAEAVTLRTPKLVLTGERGQKNGKF